MKARLDNSTARSSGCDEIFYEMFQVCTDYIVPLLCGIWNKSGEVGYLLRNWQAVTLPPLYKKNVRTDPTIIAQFSCCPGVNRLLKLILESVFNPSTGSAPLKLASSQYRNIGGYIVRYAACVAAGMNYTAVLHLKIGLGFRAT